MARLHLCRCHAAIDQEQSRVYACQSMGKMQFNFQNFSACGCKCTHGITPGQLSAAAAGRHRRPAPARKLRPAAGRRRLRAWPPPPAAAAPQLHPLQPRAPACQLLNLLSPLRTSHMLHLGISCQAGRAAALSSNGLFFFSFCCASCKRLMRSKLHIDFVSLICQQ